LSDNKISFFNLNIKETQKRSFLFFEFFLFFLVFLLHFSVLWCKIKNARNDISKENNNEKTECINNPIQRKEVQHR